jgi:hypothetical protein
MWAIREQNEVRVSAELVRALAGFDGGYSVTLHAQPRYLFIVDAPTVDRAHEIALGVAAREGLPLSGRGATVVRREGE